ncbi:hypothetical protein ABQE48_13075 [Mycolicibacterium thermoresistibile]
MGLMGWFSEGYQPTAKDRYNERKARERDARRQRDADRREALRIQQQTLQEERRAAERRRKEQEAAEKEADRQAAATEKELLTAPINRKKGGTRKNANRILVWHRSVEPPADFPVKQRRKGLGVVCGLPPGGGLGSDDAFLKAILAKYPDAEQTYPAWVEAQRAALRELRDRYPILWKLRDDNLMAEVFESAGVTLTDTETRTEQGTYGVYTRKVNYTVVPELIGVTIGNAGLELTYKRRAGESTGMWTKKLDVLKASFQTLGVDSHDLEIDTDAELNILLRFNDRDPLSEPLPQKVVPYDEVKGRSYLGRAADGSDVFVTIKNNASTLIAGMQGSGKTASIMPVIAGMIGHVELHIIDCAGSGEWEVFKPICASYDDSGELGAVETVMRYALTAASQRMAKVRSLGAINFWEVPPAKREAAGLLPVVIILEEAPMALGSGQSSKDDKQQAETNMALTGKVVKTVRKAGMTVWIITQKPAATEIPTIVRDNAGQRVCFRLDSDTAAQTALGDSAFVEPKPTSLPAGKPGRFIARVDTRGNIMGQGVFVPLDGIAAYVSGCSRVGVMGEESAPAAAHSTSPEPETPTATTAVSEDYAVPPAQSAPMTDEERERREMLVRRVRLAQGRGLLPLDLDVDDEDAVLAALAEAQRKARGESASAAQPDPPTMSKGWD